jgi:hypothetical protein
MLLWDRPHVEIPGFKRFEPRICCRDPDMRELTPISSRVVWARGGANISYDPKKIIAPSLACRLPLEPWLPPARYVEIFRWHRQNLTWAAQAEGRMAVALESQQTWRERTTVTSSFPDATQEQGEFRQTLSNCSN